MPEALKALDPLLRLIPTVPRPRQPVSIGTRLFWTFIAITIYLLMSITPLYGVVATIYFTTPELASILGISFGTLAHLGVTPIVIAGIILEILVFSEVLKLNLEDPQEQARFNLLLKFLALLIAIGESTALVASGQLITSGALANFLVVIQLTIATLIIILLDDMITKGWGIGSGISLFILVAIVKGIFARMFSPYTPPGSDLPYGVVPALIVALYHAVSGDFAPLTSIIYRTNGPSLIGLAFTILMVLAILYLELMRVSIPVTIAQYRGLRFTIPLKLMYVSVLPIIFTAYTVYLIGHILTLIWSEYNRANANPILNVIACAHISPSGLLIPCKGSLLYYFTVVPPNIDASYVIVHIIIYAILSVLYANVWVSLAGLSAEDQARYIVRSGLQVPGFRPNPRIIAKLLERYIKALTIVSGMLAGVIAAIGDVAGVFGGGIGLMLVVEIVIQYYALALREHIFEVYPGLKRIIGEEMV